MRSCYLSGADYAAFKSGLVDALRMTAVRHAQDAGLPVVVAAEDPSFDLAAGDFAIAMGVFPIDCRDDRLGDGEPEAEVGVVYELPVTGRTLLAGIVANRSAHAGATLQA